MKLAVLGAGAWGTALSISLARRHKVTLWARDEEQARELAATRTNRRYLPGLTVPDGVQVSSDLRVALEACELILIATPTAGLRPTLRRLHDAADTRPLILLCKGFEAESAQLPHQIAADEAPAAAAWAALSGPSFASEIARGLPAALTLASNN